MTTQESDKHTKESQDFRDNKLEEQVCGLQTWDKYGKKAGKTIRIIKKSCKT